MNTHNKCYDDESSARTSMTKPVRCMVLMALAISGALSGCASMNSIVPASEMEASQVFRSNADQHVLSSIAACDTATGQQDTLGLDTTTSQKGEAWAVARDYYCASIAERAASAGQIDRIKDTANDASKTKQFSQDMARVLYWQRKLAADAIAFANMNCDYHFRDAETARASFEFGESGLNTIFSAVGAGLATLSTHNRAIFNLATTATAANGISARYKATVFLTPVLRKLHKQLDGPRRDISSDIVSGLQADSIPHLSTLKSKLVEYDQLCSRENLIELLSQAVDVAKYTANDEVPIQDRAQAKKLVAELVSSAKVDEGVLTDIIRKTLWILSSMPDKDKIIANMKKNANATIKAKGELAEKILTGANAAKNSAKLNQIAVLLREDDDDDVPTLRAALTKFTSPTQDTDAGANFATAMSVATPKTQSRRDKSINEVSTRIRAISAAR